MDVICHKEICVCGCTEWFIHFYKDINDVGNNSLRFPLPINGYSLGTFCIYIDQVINDTQLPTLFILDTIYVKKKGK